MKIPSAIILFFVVANSVASDCPAKKTTSKLICYYSKLTHVDTCKCSHVVLPADSDVKSIDRLREHLKGVKILITVNEFNQGLVNILKSSKVDGIEIDLKKLDSKNDINDFISTVRSKLGSDLYIVLSVPAKTETLAKYYDFKSLSKNADLFILQTAFLGASKNVTFHPSRLSGLWDMQNTDSVVDLVSGLGAPLSKVIIAAPVQAFKFKLQSEKHTAPGSPALEVQSITRDELCNVMGNGRNWTLERDQDQAGPYIFSSDQWIAFDDPTSIDIKAKYARVRGLAGLALKDVSQDGGTKCESSILDAAFNGLSRQARAPRGAVLHSLEREILETPVRPLDTIQVSPYRISRVIDVEGSVHVIRKDTRTEFECSRQGYFVHPRSCGRFYRCVKFDQLSDEFSVFEFDCPAGLAFDSRVEVCVWPGSLSHGSPCSGSSEIAPVPRERFVCPHEPGYYADPENCRWFFACLDHGKSPLSAYEFRCPFGLVYDESRLLCEWPWLVPKCGSGYAVASEVVYGGSVALDQYNGLGVLGVTALGGLHGPLQQPVQQVYSNVGLVSQGTGQLSLKAAQSLESAGLLKTGYVVGQGGASATGYHGGNLDVGLQSGGAGLVYTNGQGGASVTEYRGGNSGIGLQSGGAGLVYTNGQGGASATEYRGGAGLVYTNGQGGASVTEYRGGNSGISLQSGGAGLVYTNGQGGASATEYRGGAGLVYTNGQGGASVTEYRGSTSGIGLQNSGASGASLTEYQNGNSGIGLQSGGAGLVYTNGQSGASVSEYRGSTSGTGAAGLVYTNGQEQNVNSGFGYTGSGLSVANLIDGTATAAEIASSQSYAGTTNAHLVNGLATNLQYQDTLSQGAKSTVEYGSGTRGKINIVGGGYSAVGVGENSNIVLTHVAESPTVTAIPTVTAVPVPALKVATGFQSYKGGVVANVPELQYKVQGNIAASRGSSGFANISTSYVNLVSSTPSTLITQDGYHYPKPTVAFVEESVKVQPVVISSTPAPTPVVVDRVNIQPVVSTYKQDTSFVGYDYPKPEVRFEETPVKALGGGFSYQNVNAVKQNTFATIQREEAVKPVVVEQTPQLYVSSPSASVQQAGVSFANVQEHVKVQPQVHVSYNVPSSTVRPVVVEQTPQLYVSSTPASIVQKQAAVSFANVQKHAVQPQIQLTSYNVPSSTVKPVVVQQVPQFYVSSTPASVQQGGVSFAKVQQRVKVQPQVHVSYNVPSSTVRPVVVEQTPELYVSSTPATIVQQQAAVSFANVQKHVVQPQIQLTSYNVPSSTVTPVVQQVPQFYASSTPVSVQPVIKQQTQVDVSSYQTPSSTVTPIVQPAVISSFSISSNSEGYRYDRPKVAFEERPTVVTYQQPAVQKTVIATQPAVATYNYQAKPAVSSYNYKNVVQSVRQGYSYPKPVVRFEEVPASVTKLEYAQQPTVYASYSYTAPSTVKPAITYAKQVPVYSTPKSAIFLQKQPAVVTYTPKPVVLRKKPTVISSYSFTAQPVKNLEFSGYNYPKPVGPVLTYENREPVREVPFVAKKAYVTGGQSTSYQYAQQYNKVEQRPLVVESYQAPVSSTPLYEYQQKVEPIQEEPFVAKKAYVTGSQSGSYQYTQQYNKVEQRPLVVESYQAPVTSTPLYEYQQKVEPIQEISFGAKTGDQSGSYQYTQQFNKVEQRPLVVENYQVPISTTPLYEYQEKVVSTTPRYEYKQQYTVNSGYVYDKPTIQFEEKPVVPSGSYYIDNRPRITQKFVTSTPKPTFASAINSVIEAKQPFRFYDSRLISTARPVTYSTSLPVVETVTTSRPIVKFSFSSLDSQYQQRSKDVESYQVPLSTTPLYEYQEKVVSTTPTYEYKQQYSANSGYVYDKPTIQFEEKPVVPVVPSASYYIDNRPRIISTPKPTFASAINAVVEAKQPFRFYDSRLVSTARPVTYSTSLPVTETVTTSRPIAKFSFGSSDSQYQQVSKDDYVAVRRPIAKYSFNEVAPVEVTTASREYLPPVTVTTSRPLAQYQEGVTVGKIVENYVAPVQVTTAAVPLRIEETPKPVEIVGKSRTIIKLNDFHPLLPAKLGAQCTCVSNSVKLRKKPIRIVVEDDDDDGYVVDNGDHGVVVENYQYEPQKVVEITPTPEIYIKSSTTEVPSSTRLYSARRRVRVRPVTKATDVFVQDVVTPTANAVTDDSRAKLSIESGKFDRYGPGGWRSRDEKLQGTIDCQRAGLFRHPTQCNKFYACRWDCTKNRYTLHVFNCPVHLTFDNNLGACNWPSQGPACLENTLLPSD